MRRGSRWLLLVLVAVVAAVVAVGVVWWWRDSSDALVGQRQRNFPEIDVARLDAGQAELVRVLRQEFADPGSGRKYAEGVSEPWCADFVSWSFREAGHPLANPNSGSWRIPGVYTLEEYYRGTGQFRPLDTGYQLRTGDVLLYGPESPFGQHTNIVLQAHGDTVTTIGGNEGDEIRIHTFTLGEVPALVGAGTFP